MNGPGDNPLAQTSGISARRTCSFVAIIPIFIFGMSSCRGKAEAFARRFSSQLQTLSTLTDNDSIFQEDEPTSKRNITKTWVTANHLSAQNNSHIQFSRDESDSVFDFECKLESPESSLDKYENLGLEKKSSNNAHNSECTCTFSASSNCFADVPFSDEKDKLIPNATRELVSLPAVEKENSNEDFNKNCNLNDLEEYEDIEDIKTVEKRQFKNTEQCNAVCLREVIRANSTKDSRYDVLNKKTLQVTEDMQKEIKQKGFIFDSRSINEKDYLHSSVCPPVLQEKANSLGFTKTFHCVESITFPNSFLNSGEEILKIKFKDLRGESDGSLESEKHTSKTPNSRQSLLAATVSAYNEDGYPERVRRCSSLKTGKTPPGTPERKKIVRFADVLGLDLADIKTFLDEIPTIPKSAFEDLEIIEDETQIRIDSKKERHLLPLFQQPGELPSFLELFRAKQVALENAVVENHIYLKVTGSVRVRNLGFHKSVHIRYTLDNWRSFTDLQANYVENSCDGISDKFTFFLFANTLQIGQRLEFAVRFQCRGQQFWDNNFGKNYSFHCLPTSTKELLKPKLSQTPHHNNNLMGMLSPMAGEEWCNSFH